MLVRKLFRTAWKYKAQFFSMIVMVTIGVGIFLGFNIEWKSIEEDTGTFFTQTHYADFRLYAEIGFSKEDIEAIEKIEGVTAATRFLSVNVDIKDQKQSLSLNVSENYTVSTVLVMEGEEYDADREGIWLSDQFAQKNELKVGDTLTLVYGGIEIEGKILGLVKSGEQMICVADENQLMPDFTVFGFAYISPKMLESVLGGSFYSQINLRADMDKEDLRKEVTEALGRTVLILSKDEHVAYAGAQSEAEEGKTMAAILPVLFLGIAVLTMITTMHRIAANEKVQIGTLKALGFRDGRILRHYTSYGFVLGLVGTLLGIAGGYGIALLVISPGGMMSTYFDLPDWRLVMPGFCVPILFLVVVFLTSISYLSTAKMLKGTAADALRPFIPKAMKKGVWETFSFWDRLSFDTKWNIRDILRHKSRSAMTLIGVVGCMLLLVGSLGMKDTMEEFLQVLDEDISNYVTRVNLSETAKNSESALFAEQVNGDWLASSGISYDGETVVLEIYSASNEKIRFVDRDNHLFKLTDDGVYLCMRLMDTAKIGDLIEISPYGSEETYSVRVAGYLRSIMTECIVMTDAYADSIGIPYHIAAVFTDKTMDEIETSSLIAGTQDKRATMDSYDSFMDIMDTMVIILAAAAILLGVIVLYNLGAMSYLERSRELATLKVLGFRDRHIGRLLIRQNVWLTVLGILIGLPGGVGVLWYLLTALASEYELKLAMGPLTYIGSIVLTFLTSLAVGWMVAGKNRKIDMVEA